MDNIVEKVKERMIKISDEAMLNNQYDDWNNHIGLVYKNAHDLAIERNADVEIVDLAAILHDVARVSGYGPIEEHHIYGAELAGKILEEYEYPRERIERVQKCVLNHTDNPKESVEEEIIADADVLAHFDNISMLYYIFFYKRREVFKDAKEDVKKKLEFDWNKLSPYGKEKYKDRYEEIMKILFGYC